MAPKDAVSSAREAFASGASKKVSWRLEQLRSLLRMFDENESALCEALAQDLSKPRQEAILYEVTFIKNVVVNAINNVVSITILNSAVPILLTLANSSRTPSG